MKTRKRIDRHDKESLEFVALKAKLSQRRMAGFKFNYQLEECLQNFTSYHMYLEFSKDAEYMLILNRKPVTN